MSAAHQRRHLVIVVEDAGDCSAALEVALASASSFHVRSYGSAEEALETLLDVTPAAVVTDIHLPGLDGLALIRILRARFPESPLVILAVSGDSDPELVSRAIEAGANAFMPKPYSPREVRRFLEDLIHAT
jgi:DNA-binding response OmpR family regulator